MTFSIVPIRWFVRLSIAGLVSLSVCMGASGCRHSAASVTNDFDSDTDMTGSADSDSQAEQADIPKDSETGGSDVEPKPTADEWPTFNECYPEKDVAIHDADALDRLKPYPCVNGNLLIDGLDVASLDLPNLRWVGTDLSISECSRIKNLSGLTALEQIGQQLDIHRNPSLQSLDGLASLSAVHQIFVEENPSLTDLSALQGISTAWSVSVNNNDALQNLSGLENLITLDWSLGVNRNAMLNNISALENLQSVGNQVFITSNPMLKRCDVCELKNRLSVKQIFEATENMPDGCSANCDLNISGQSCIMGEIVVEDATDRESIAPYTCIEGSLRITADSSANINLPNLKSVSGNLLIVGNDSPSPTSLTTLTGLGALESVGGTLYIQNTALLSDLSALTSLTSVGALNIAGNASLTSLSDLSWLTTVSSLWITDNPVLSNPGLDSLSSLTGDFAIYSNPALPQCDVYKLSERLGGNRRWTCIQNNSADTCESFCPSYPME
ncbi:MAG: hypothetical protein JXX14_21705 [Deltaproteobacteria bacterium]|nr:hypothetical protein [Deltaproteobacteria bacterium]